MTELRNDSEANAAMSETAEAYRRRSQAWRSAPACSGPCEQGRRICLTPDACQRPAEPEIESGGDWVFAIGIAAISLVCAVCAVWPWIAR